MKKSLINKALTAIGIYTLIYWLHKLYQKHSIQKLTKISYFLNFLLKDKLIDKQESYKIALKEIAIKDNIQNFDATDISIKNICRLMKECKETDKVAVFLSRNHVFTKTEEKKLFLEAVYFTTGDILILNNLSIDFQEAVELTNELQIGRIAALYLESNAPKLSYAQNMQLLNLCDSFQELVTHTCMQLTIDDIAARSRRTRSLYLIAEFLLAAGLSKQKSLEFIETTLQDFDDQTTTLDLSPLTLTKEEILIFIKRNPGWGHVLDNWVRASNNHEDLSIETRRELLEIRLATSTDYISQYSIDYYNIPTTDLYQILYNADEYKHYIDISILRKFEWDEQYTLYKKYFGHELSGIFDLKEMLNDGSHSGLEEYLSNFPDNFQDLQEQYPSIEELRAYLKDLSSNLTSIFCKLTSCSAEVRANLQLVEDKLFNVESNSTNIITSLNNFMWWVGLNSRLLVELTANQIQHCFAQKAIITALEEVVSFASADFYVKVSDIIINLLKNDKRFTTFCQLSGNKNRHTQIAALIISANVQNSERFTDILKLIGREYHDSKNLKFLINGFITLFCTADLSDDHKFKAAHKALSYDIDFTIVNNSEEMNSKHEAYLNGKLNSSRMLITQIAGKPKFGLLTYDINGRLINLEDISSDHRLKELGSILEAWVKNGTKIHRVIKQILPIIANTNVFPCGLRSEQQALVVLQGLGAINKLASTLEDPKFQIKSWMDLNGNVLQSCFDIPEDKLGAIQSTISTCRNQFSMVAYYAQLNTAPITYASSISMLKFYAHSIASPGAQDFYTYRYNPVHQPQLKTVIGNNQKLLSSWRRGKETSYNDFYNLIKDKIKHTAKKQIDAKKFIKHRICHFKHLSELKFDFIHKFLAAKAKKQRSVLYKSAHEKMNSIKNENYNTVSKKINLELQLALMDYFNKEHSLSAQEKLQALFKITNICDNCKDARHFEGDMDYLTNVLWKDSDTKKRNNLTKEKDTKGWKIVDTDNFWDMLLIGTDVLGSCQDINGSPSLNHCLIGGYILSGHVRQIAIKNFEGGIIARAIFRLMHDKITKKPVLFLEEVYPQFIDDVYSKAIEAFAMLRAWQLGSSLVCKIYGRFPTPYDNPIEVVSVKGAEYVDALGTKQTSGYEITGSSLIYDVPQARIELQKHLDAAGMLMGRAGYGPRPLNSVHDLVFMYQNYCQKINSQSMPKQFYKKNIRALKNDMH